MRDLVDWSKISNFTRDEFKCKYSGDCFMNAELVHIIQDIRTEIGKPLFISSGYRHPKKHPIEQTREKKGEHTLGFAADIICHGKMALAIIALAQYYGIKRIGVHQKGRASSRFVHLGVGDRYDLGFPVGIWTY